MGVLGFFFGLCVSLLSAKAGVKIIVFQFEFLKMSET